LFAAFCSPKKRRKKGAPAAGYPQKYHELVEAVQVILPWIIARRASS
jgi:hypothetical protein